MTLLYLYLLKLNTNHGEKCGVYPEIEGTITLASERIFCASCSDVVKQFSEMYPNVIIKTVNGAQ